MYKITWDKETGGVLLHTRIVDGTLGVSPRPVFYEELNLLGLDKLGWKYPHCQEPLLWAVNKQYYYRGELVFEAKGANIYDAATIVFANGVSDMKMHLKPVDMEEMLKRNRENMFTLESEAVEFIYETYNQYAKARKSAQKVASNQLDYEALAKRIEAKRKQKMAIVKENCDSFEIMPLYAAEEQGRKVYQTTKIDRFLASFSGGKDSQVVLDLCTRAMPSTEFEVIYSDTGYELPPSLELYEEIQKLYHEKYPDLQFRMARNHAPVLEYWDKIGTPSDTHRWCCSIMKTAPLYRMLKNKDGKPSKVLTFDGVRAEESVRRSNYQRIGQGKHTTIHNAHPIINWNTVEIYLYLFQHKLPINAAYREGKARVGCIICPFSTSWDDMIVKHKYQSELKPFEERIRNWAAIHKISDIDEYLKERRWKIKAIGDRNVIHKTINFQEKHSILTATVKGASFDIFHWLHALCEYTVHFGETEGKGSLKYKGNVYDFEIRYEKSRNNFSFTVYDIHDKQFVLYLKRVIYKSTYCVQCEVCEVDCPTGALQIFPTLSIDKTRCIHCLKCLTSHDKGCIAADSIRMINDMDKKINAKVQGYKTFGLREAWLQEFVEFGDDFWGNSSLAKPQEEGFKAWMKDAEIIDASSKLTKLGKTICDIYMDDVALVWEVILTNLSYHSFIVGWFANNIACDHEYDTKLMASLIVEQGYTQSESTAKNAASALIQTIRNASIGPLLAYNIKDSSEKSLQRAEYEDVTPVGLAYSIYKYAENKGIHSLRISDFYKEDSTTGPNKVLGISRNIFVKTLRTLNAAQNRLLTAELNMGLDSITLRDDITSLDILKF